MIEITREVKCSVGQEILVAGLSDIHLNTPDCDRERFEALVPWFRTREKYGPLAQLLAYPKVETYDLDNMVGSFPHDPGSQVFLIGGGDYNDTFSPSERAALAAAKGGFGLHETTLELLDSILIDMTETFYNVVAPIQHTFLGLLEGHHYGDILTGTEGLRGVRSTEYLAKLIGCPYLGDMALITLDFIDFGLKFVIHAMHGYGSARTVGAQVIKRVRMSEVVEGADLYLMGHDNNKAVVSREPLRIGPDGTLGHHKQYFAGMGSFQRGYRFNTPYGNYVEKLALPPHMLGINIAALRVEERDGKYRLDYHISS